MVTSNYLARPWSELINAAQQSLEARDTVQLKQLNAVFHHRFINQIRRGDRASKAEFIANMLHVTESPEARQIEEPSKIQRLLCQWAHLDILMDILHEDGDLIGAAERFVESRAHARELLEIVGGTQEWGIKAGDLAGRLNISRQHLTALLKELEQHDLVDRHTVGRNVYVGLGLVGQALAERHAQMGPRLVQNTEQTVAVAGSLEFDKFPEAVAQYTAAAIEQLCEDRQKSGVMLPLGA